MSGRATSSAQQAVRLYDAFGSPIGSGGVGDALNVFLTNGGAGGTSTVDETPFIAGASLGTPIMAEDPTSGELLMVIIYFPYRSC